MKRIGYLRNTGLNITDKWAVFSFLLFIGVILVCMPVNGQAILDTQGNADNNTPIWEQYSYNQAISDDFGFDSDHNLSDPLLKYQIPTFSKQEYVSNSESTPSIFSINNAEAESESTEENSTDLQLTWQRCLGGSDYEMSYSMIQTTDGGFLVGGITYSNDGDVIGQHGSSDLWVVKYDATQNLLWQRCLGGSDYEEFTSVIQTSDGGYLVNGDSYSDDANVTGNHGNGDIWVVKLDSEGNIIWEKCLGGTGNERSQSVFQTTDGGYLVSGYTRSTDGDVSGNHGNWDIWVVKLDSEGNILWEKCLGGTGNERPHSVIPVTSGGYLVSGYTNYEDGDVTGIHGSWDIWEVKLDSEGDILWEKCLGGTGIEDPYSALQTTDGGFVVVGYTDSDDGNVTGNHGYYDIWTINLDIDGNLTWQKCLGGTSNDEPYARLIQTTDGGYLVSGCTYSDDGNVTGNHGLVDIWEVKLDPEGEITWQKCLGGTYYEYPEYVFQTSDGGYMVAGTTLSDDGDVTGHHGYADIWAVKLDPDGNLTWQKCLGGTSYEEPYAGIFQTTDGRYVIGGFTDSSDDDVVGTHGNIDIWMTLLTASHPITATSDSWTIAYPPSTQYYTEETNVTYLAQAKPGADLVNVSVDSIPVGPVSNWTFSMITGNHTFATTGEPTPGQVHAFFTINTTWGTVPLTVQFTNQSLGDPTSFSWNFGDGGSSAERDPIHTYTVPGTYSVTLLATNSGTGGIATLSNALTATAGVVPSPTQTPEPGEITAAFSADITAGSAPMQVSFVDQSTGNPTSWIWNLGDGNLSTSRNVTHIYSAKGTYSVGLTARNSAYSGSIEKSRFIVVS